MTSMANEEGRWVTINGNPVLIKDDKGGGKGSHGGGNSKQSKAPTAKEHKENVSWVRKSVERGQRNFPNDQPRILKEAAQVAAAQTNDPDHFMKTMNDAMIPVGASPMFDLQVRGKILQEQTQVQPKIGTTGIDPRYNDKSSNQISNHFWGYVGIGYQHGTWGGRADNVIHEKLEPLVNKKTVGSKQDWDLSVQGYNLGRDIKNGTISVKDVPKRAEAILTGKYTYPKGAWE
jgi:hypothetical protein